MKRVYLFQPSKLDFIPEAPPDISPTFWIIDELPVWSLGDGWYQVICEEGKCPEWAVSGEDIRNIDKNPTKKTNLKNKYQVSVAKGTKIVDGFDSEGEPIMVDVPERKLPLPQVVLLGMVPEDLVQEEKLEEEVLPGKVVK